MKRQSGRLARTIAALLVAAGSFSGALPGTAAASIEPGAAVGRPDLAPLATPATGTYQDFDLPAAGTPYSLGIHVPTIGPQTVTGGPTEDGKLMRLAYAASPTVTHNSLAFDRSTSGAADLVVADFDFRLTPGVGRADGLGFALLNTVNYGTSGAVAPGAPTGIAEEPSFVASISVGFDLYDSGPEINNNHVSLHFNGQQLVEVDATPSVDLGSGGWIHARIILRPGGGFSDATVILGRCGAPAFTLIDRTPVTGFVPYEGRVWFGARSGGESADHDIDNVNVQFLSATDSLVSFANGCQQVRESAGQLRVSVSRIGNLGGPASVRYEAYSGSALSGPDFSPISGTLSFAAGESTKLFTVPIISDTLAEGSERFLLALDGPTGALLGGPAFANVRIVDDPLASQQGAWGEVLRLPGVPIHLNLLPDGRLLFWDRHEDTLGWMGDPRLWDLDVNVISNAAQIAYDLFCSGMSLLPDGRLFVSGGHIADQVGEDKASIYDPKTDSWTSLPDMNAGRWYPTNTTLPSGDVLVMAGTIDLTTINTVPQVFQQSTGSWRDLTTAVQGGLPGWPDFYPWNFVAPNGRIFSAGPQQVARSLNVAGTGGWSDVAISSLLFRDYGSATMYDNGKIVIAGGNRRPISSTDVVTPSAIAETIDLNSFNPVWQPVAPLATGRRHLNLTTLPDGTVLATGGTSGSYTSTESFDKATGAVLTPELWNPATNTWTPLAPHQRYRGYHSVALLLPDGRVLIAGGGHPDPADGQAEPNAEIYSPPYLFKGPRPVITGAPNAVAYGQQFLVQTPDASRIQKVHWMRLGTVTHAFNQNQHFNRLSFSQAPGGLRVSAPTGPNLAPPGHYLLFAVDGAGVPSVARIVQILDQPDLAVTIAPSPATVLVGAPLTLTIHFTNTGSLTATGVSLTAVLPANLSLQSVISAGPAITATGPLSWQIGPLPPGAAGTIAMRSLVQPGPGTYGASATISGTNDLVLDNNSAVTSFQVDPAPPTVTPTATPTVTATSSPPPSPTPPTATPQPGLTPAAFPPQRVFLPVGSAGHRGW